MQRRLYSLNCSFVWIQRIKMQGELTVNTVAALRPGIDYTEEVCKRFLYGLRSNALHLMCFVLL